MDIKSKYKILEAEVENYLRKRVEAVGGEVRKVQWIGRRNAPDRFVMLPKVVLFVETKAPGEEPRAGQIREHDRMRTFGVRVDVIDSKDQVDALIAEGI